MKKVLCRGVSFLSFFFFFSLLLLRQTGSLCRWSNAFRAEVRVLSDADGVVYRWRGHLWASQTHAALNYLSAAAQSWRIHVCSLMEWSCRCFLRTLTFPNRWLRRICCTLFLICLFYAHKLSIMQKINIIYNWILWSYKFKKPKTLVSRYSSEGLQFFYVCF